MPKTSLPKEFLVFLINQGLLEPRKAVKGAPMVGGVSSDIWRIELLEKSICIKRALPRLNVEASWSAPIERNTFEVKWMQVVGELFPTIVPSILAHDPQAGMFAMPFLDSQKFKLWKTELLNGNVSPDFAGSVGLALANIHSATMNDPDTERNFPTDKIFHSIRLEPYLEATARIHPDVAEALYELVLDTQNNKIALVHGDVSPKNIMIGPEGPVFLDAECAWYGDPAFDLAFCLNHLLLKCLYRPDTRTGYATSFETMTRCYLDALERQRAKDIEVRAARLLPGLLLARVDGTSPVEYITKENDKNQVRRFTKNLLSNPLSSLQDVCAAWQKEFIN